MISSITCGRLNTSSLATKAADPACCIAVRVKVSVYVEKPITAAFGTLEVIHLVASMPSNRGMWTSMITISGRSCSASPTNSHSGGRWTTSRTNRRISPRGRQPLLFSLEKAIHKP
jgi:hypothetical protein